MQKCIYFFIEYKSKSYFQFVGYLKNLIGNKGFASILCKCVNKFVIQPMENHRNSDVHVPTYL